MKQNKTYVAEIFLQHHMLLQCLQHSDSMLQSNTLQAANKYQSNKSPTSAAPVNLYL